VIRRSILGLAACAACVIGLSAASPAKAADNKFYLKPGDRVVFYGDSITDQRLYTTYIESYCVTRFPSAHFTFVHSGWGGDRVTGGGGGNITTRINRDILPYRPTVVTICLGMNDGSYRSFDNGIFATYINGYRHIIETLKKELPGVRITVVTAPVYDDVTRPANFPGGYNATLVAYNEAVRALAKEFNLTVADTNAPLISVLARAHSEDAAASAKIIPDRVHPGPGGHVVMAAAVLKAWNAPATVADIEINAAATHVDAKGASISDLAVKDGTLSFTEKDKVLPWPIDRSAMGNPDTGLVLHNSDIEKELNTYRLRVGGLSASRYSIKIDGTDCGTFSKDELAAGVDLAGLEKSPSFAGANKVLSLTRKHNDLHFRRWRQVQITRGNDGLNPSPEVKAQMDALDAQDAAAVAEQLGAVKTAAHKVVIAPAS
jgi:lysophospholipase L1-like esterase